MKPPADDNEMTVRFWGVRGSIPAPGAETLRGGGNTACVEIRCGSHVLLFDAGSGLRQAGEALVAEGVRSFDLFLSHCHYDHMIGLPFFRPLMSRDANCVLWSGHLHGSTTTRELIAAFMRPPFFPVNADTFRGRMTYRDFKPGDILAPRDGVRILTAPLHHPGGVVGFRVEYAGHAVAYMTDTEHGSDETESAMRMLAERADLVIYDCMYTEEQFRTHPGYGHSTWEYGVRLCVSAGARRLAMFHHAPSCGDQALDRLEAEACAAFPGAFAAREGFALKI